MTSRARAAGRSWTALVIGCTLAVVASAQGQSCPGDCNSDGTVSLQEAVLAMRISLERGGAQLSDCTAADSDLDGTVGLGDLTRAAASLRNECGNQGAGAVAATSGAGGTPAVTVSNESGAPGQIVSFSVTLNTAGHAVAGVDQETFLDGPISVIDCTANPGTNKPGFFSLRPVGCTPGDTCTSVRALILSLTNVDPIADGSVLFTCDVQISGAAPTGIYVLDSRFEDAADPSGNTVVIDGHDGSIEVAHLPTPTPTAIPVPASLILEKVRLKADTAERPGRDTGSINLRGVVNANDPFAHFVEDIGASGLGLRVFGAGGVDQTFHWTAADCDVEAGARGPRIRCAAADRRIDFRATRIPNLFRAKLVAKRLDFPPPLTAGTVAAVLSTATFERSDTIGGCKVSRSGRASTCRESGFVPTATPTIAPPPTATFTVTPTPTNTPIPPDETTIVVGDAVGVPGGTTSFTVGLESGESVAGVENELHLDPVAALSFVACSVNPDIDKDLFYNISTPSDLKALVLSLVSLDTIPNGSIMYTCEIGIGASVVPADYLIDCTDPGASDPSGNELPSVCSDGVLTVSP